MVGAARVCCGEARALLARIPAVLRNSRRVVVADPGRALIGAPEGNRRVDIEDEGFGP